MSETPRAIDRPPLRTRRRAQRVFEILKSYAASLSAHSTLACGTPAQREKLWKQPLR